MKPVPLNLDTLGISYDCFTWNTFLRLVSRTSQIPYITQGVYRNVDEPEAKIVTTDTLLIFLNGLQREGSKTLQKYFYRKNSAMTQFMMIP